MLSLLLSAVIKRGTLRVIWPNGSSRSFGSGAPHATIRLTGRRTPLALALRPELAVGEAYMDRRLILDEGDLSDLLHILVANTSVRVLPSVMRFAGWVRRWLQPFAQFNSPRRARRNAAHHYDLSDDLYALFLDEDRQYSCAYYPRPDMALEEAQAAKKRHIAAKLRLDRPGLRVLEIGSGWGGLALRLARDHGADVLSVTLSTEQLAVCRRRAEEQGLADQCRFALCDYRAVEGRFDRIVSVAMFEAVGVNYYDAFFGKVADLLAEDGVAFLHTIGRMDGPCPVNPWLAKYIFPGSHAPALSEMLPAIERAGLYVADVEVLRLHYAETLQAWLKRFRANWSKAAALYDERFCRMWEFYLAGCEMTFRVGSHAVFQLQLAKRMDALPLTRDYMLDAARAPNRGAKEPRVQRVA